MSMCVISVGTNLRIQAMGKKKKRSKQKDTTIHLYGQNPEH